MNKDKVLSDLSALIDQAGGGESSNGKQQSSIATPDPMARATETTTEWVCSKAPNWATRSFLSLLCDGASLRGRTSDAPPKPAPAPKKNAAVTYAEAVRDTNSSKATEKKEKEAARESLKAEAEQLEMVLDALRTTAL